jgi:hypothetical protein
MTLGAFILTAALDARQGDAALSSGADRPFAGFADVLVLMLAAIWFARRHERRRGVEQATRGHTAGGGVRAGFGIRPSRSAGSVPSHPHDW